MNAADDFNKHIERVFAVNKLAIREREKDEPKEVEIEPGLYKLIGKSGKVYAIYGENFRQACKDLYDNDNRGK